MRGGVGVVVRGGAGVLAGLNLWWGAWARFAPRHFFDTFPGFGHTWTAAYPPYNEHLVTDLGSTFLTLAFLLGIAAVTADVRIRRVVFAAVLVFNGLHLSFHAMDRGAIGPFDFGASVTALAFGVVAPVALLLIEFRWPSAKGPDGAKAARPDGLRAPEGKPPATG